VTSLTIHVAWRQSREGLANGNELGLLKLNLPLEAKGCPDRSEFDSSERIFLLLLPDDLEVLHRVGPGAHAQVGKAHREQARAVRVRERDPAHVGPVAVLLGTDVIVDELVDATGVASDRRAGVPIPVVLGRSAAESGHRPQRGGHGHLHAEARQLGQRPPGVKRASTTTSPVP